MKLAGTPSVFIDDAPCVDTPESEVVDDCVAGVDLLVAVNERDVDHVVGRLRRVVRHLDDGLRGPEIVLGAGSDLNVLALNVAFATFTRLTERLPARMDWSPRTRRRTSLGDRHEGRQSNPDAALQLPARPVGATLYRPTGPRSVEPLRNASVRRMLKPGRPATLLAP